jgi:hypothetical protein
MNVKADREDVTLQKGTPSQPGVVAKESPEVSKKRTSILGDIGKPGSEETKKAESVLSKFQTEVGHGHGQHVENEKGSGLGRSSSNASNRSRTAEVGSKVKLDHSALGNEAASASAPTLVHLEGNDTVTSSPASDRPPTITSGFHPLPKPASIKSNDTPIPNSETLGADIDRSASPGTAAHSASLLESFRARDKQAIAAQVSSAKSVVRKWGIDFAAKRRADFQAPAIGTGIKGQQTQPQAIYRPQEDDRLHSSHAASTSGASTSLGHSPNRTLQERLNDAAKAAAIANSTTTTNRERSHSNLSNSSSSSRPTLLASPSKSGAVAGPSISEPTFTLSDQKPRRDSVPVLMQPSAGRGMVVPRVVKRPGEVTGLGNSPGQGLTRKISEDAGSATPSATGNKTPDVPPRKSAESDRPGVPPPLPKKPDMSELGVEMQRSGSAPIPSTPSNEITEPNQIIGLTKSDDDIESEKEKEIGDLVDTSIPQPGPSGAQDALRKLADKNT